jgi:hypothetical protein
MLAKCVWERWNHATKQLIPYLHEKNGEIVITIDVMRKINIPNVTTLKDIASIIGFECIKTRINGKGKPMKVIKGSREKFCRFLEFET